MVETLLVKGFVCNRFVVGRCWFSLVLVAVSLFGKLFLLNPLILIKTTFVFPFLV